MLLGIMPFAGVVYDQGTPSMGALSQFVKNLKLEKVCVEGILQEDAIGYDGAVIGVDAIDILTGSRIGIKRLMKDEHECGLDISALIEATAIIRKAIDRRPDLMVIEKFGDQEQKGEGMSDEIWQTITAGIPLIVSVPEKALNIWLERSGGMGSVLPFSETALHEWWNATCPK